MNQPTDDELISAYLDGELSGEELLRAERMLEERPECRQLVEELRAIGGGLRGLPRHKLDDDFADRVLRRAEREMLSAVSPVIAPPVTVSQATVSQTPVSQATGPQKTAHEAKAPQGLVSASKSPAWDGTETEFQPDLLSWRRWRRPAVWSSLAVAAALLIMFLGSPRMQLWQANNHLAQAPAPHVTTESDRTKDLATRPIGGVNVDDRFARSKDGGGRGAANGISDVPSISSIDTASSDDSAQQPIAENLAKSSGGTVPDGAWSMKPESRLGLNPDATTPVNAAGSEASQYLSYQGHRGNRGEESNSSYNYFALQADGQTSPAQPLTDDVVIVQVNVDSVDAANRALHELLAKRQFTWGDSPASGANGDVAAKSPKGGQDDGRRGSGQGGAGGGRFGVQSTEGQVAGKAGAGREKSAATAKDDELAGFKPEVPAAAADFGLLREAREQGINRPLDRTQLDSSRLGRERFDRDELSIDRSASEKLGVQKQHLDSEKLAQLKASEEVDKHQSFRRAVLVEGPPAQIAALIAEVAAQKGVVQEVLLRRAAGAAVNDIVDSDAADNVSPPNSASLPNMRPEDVAAGGAKLGSAKLQKQASPNDAFGADHDYTDSVPLGGVPSAKVLPPNALPPSAPPDHPSASPSVTRMTENQPRPAPVAPDARNWAEEDKKTEAGTPAGATNKAEAARESDSKSVDGSKSGRSELRQMPPGQAKSDKAAPNTSAPKEATQKAEATRSQRGTDRARDMRRNKGKLEPSAAPLPSPKAPAAAAPKLSASRTLAEPPPAAVKMAEEKAAPPAPVDAKSAPAASEPSPPAPAAVEQMPPEQAKPQDPTLPQIVAPPDSLPDYVSPTTPRADRAQVAAPADPAPRSQAASQSQAVQPQAVQPQAVQPQGVQPQGVQPQGVQPQGVQPSNSWYGRAQEVMVPEGALGEPESVQPPRFAAPNEAAKNPDTADELHGELFSKKSANQKQAPSDAPEPPAAQVELKTNAQAAEKSEPVVTELNAAGKDPIRSKPAQGRGRGIDAIKSEAEGQKEAADSQSRGLQLRLGEEIRPGGKKPGDGKPGDGKARENTRGGAPSDSKNQSQIGDRPVEKKLNDQGNPSQFEAHDARGGRFHDPAPRQVAATPPAPRRVIFVFNVQPPAAAPPVTEAVPGVHAAPSPAKAE